MLVIGGGARIDKTIPEAYLNVRSPGVVGVATADKSLQRGRRSVDGAGGRRGSPPNRIVTETGTIRSHLHSTGLICM